MANSLPSIPKLKGRENYDTWRFAVQALLELEDLWSCIEGDEETDTKKITMARSKIILLIEPINYVHVQDTKTAKECWDRLQAAFEDNGLSRRVGLLRKLISTKLDECSSVESYVNEIISTAHKLNGIGLKVTEEWVGTLLLAGLSDHYKPMIMGIESCGMKISGDSVKTKILQDVKLDESDAVAFYGGKRRFQKKRQNGVGGGGSSGRGVGSGVGGGSGPRCYQCNNFGHLARNCPAKQSNKQVVKPTSLYTSYAVSTVQPGAWYVDSGASAHMCSDPRLLSDVNQAVNSEVVVANNMRLNVQSMGNVYLPIDDCKVKVENVLCIPDLCANLLSVSQIVRKRNKVIFDYKGCKIYDPENNLLASGSLDGELFKLNCSETDYAFTANRADNALNLWHRRMGHLNFGSVRNILNDFCISNVENVQENMNCEVCAKGKQCRRPFKKSGARASDVLQLIHSDLCGPINVASMGGARYILTFVDDFTRKTFVYFLRAKSETLSRFREFKALVENECNKSIKALRTDNGSEYCGKEFQRLLRQSGIQHFRTAPYTPEHNGLIERMNRTIIEKARCMLLDANLPKHFWAEAVSTAVFLINRSPSSSSTNKVPEEAWTGVAPDMSFLRTFGCKAMVHVPKQKRKKLDAKSEACVFLGYCDGTKNYRLYNQEKDRIVISRDVIFFEDEHLYPVGDDSSSHFFEIGLASGENSEIQGVVSEVSENDLDEFSDAASEINNTEELFLESVDEPTVERTSENSEDEYILPHSVSSMTEAPEIRRSNRIPKPQKRDDYISYTVKTGELHDPFTLNEALSRADAECWRQAMAEELDSLKKNETWELVDLPSDKRPINCKWVFKTKRNSDGAICRYKARLVVKGCSQRKGIDYEETFSPVVRYSTIRFLLSLAAQYDLDIDQMDAVTAFLQGDLPDLIYMLQPEGFSDKTGKVCRLKKSLYGLKQASRLWNQKLDTALLQFGLEKSKVDPCVYFSHKNESLIIVAVYVDDILIFSKNLETKIKLKSYLHSTFQMKDMGEARFVLGIQIRRDREKGSISIDQEQYIREILARFEMSDCNPVSTPMDHNQKLTKLMCPQSDDERRELSSIPYQEAVGCIMFAAQVSRPDVSFAVSNVSRFNNDFGKPHWTAVKRILRYLKGTAGAQLRFCKSKSNEVVGFCDADWANDSDDRRSTTGYVFYSGKAAVSWNTKKQPTVALSSTEAEYMAVSSAVQEAIWLKSLQRELVPYTSKTTTINCDNKGAICLALTTAYHSRTKHIDVRHHFVRDKINEGEINLNYVSTSEMSADFLTKAVNHQKHLFCSSSVGLQLK